MELRAEMIGLDQDPPAITDYRQCWDHQRSVHASVVNGDTGATVIYVQHEPVFTAGRSAKPSEFPTPGLNFVEVDRGGKMTFHGPGQLTGYPILTLPGRVGASEYVRRMEEAIILTLADYSIVSGRIPDRTGVWLAADASRPERKICAIGVRVAKRTTMHGFGLNVTTDLSWFNRITPCGIADAGVTSIEAELGWAPSLFEVARKLHGYLERTFDFDVPMDFPDLDRGPWAPTLIPQQVGSIHAVNASHLAGCTGAAISAPQPMPVVSLIPASRQESMSS